MSTTPTLRDAAQRDALLQAALDFISTLTGMTPPPIEVAPTEVFAPFFAFVDRVQEITASAGAALTQGAGEAVEPVATLHSDGFWTPEKNASGWALNSRLAQAGTSELAYTAQQLQQAVARALEPIQQAIRDYHYALDTRQHGGVAERRAFGAICDHLGMYWKSGEEAAIRAKGTHD